VAVVVLFLALLPVRVVLAVEEMEQLVALLLLARPIQVVVAVVLVPTLP
jgi:hypothetical protein